MKWSRGVVTDMLAFMSAISTFISVYIKSKKFKGFTCITLPDKMVIVPAYHYKIFHWDPEENHWSNHRYMNHLCSYSLDHIHQLVPCTRQHLCASSSSASVYRAKKILLIVMIKYLYKHSHRHWASSLGNRGSDGHRECCCRFADKSESHHYTHWYLRTRNNY